MKKRHIAVCVPSLGTVSMPWAAAFSDLVYPLNTGVAKIFVVNKKVAEARNECVQSVFDLERRYKGIEFTHIFWVDDDVIVQSSALITLLNRRKQIISGVYFTKAVGSEPLIFRHKMRGAGPFNPGKVEKVWAHGMGLTLVEMDVYRQMRKDKNLGKDEYGMPAWYRAFDPTRRDKAQDGTVFSTEDFYFLDAANKIGIRPWVDQTQATFGWHYDMSQQRGFPSEQWEQWRKTRKLTWDTPDGPVEWNDLHV